ncbi:MAG: CRISPR-associated endonuclease Cas3'', partial [Campylobacterota bacterium]|nr:CRISPR-associated endonuclease Cas3'' [Campylobacterota bacterium]
MHKVMIVSRCQHKALKTTRKIVDSYAIRISDKSWNCNLTQEGLQNLTARLKASARKNSAIAIYFLKDGMMQKYTIIGNRKEFGLDGACPVSTTSNKHASFKYQLEYKNMSSYKIIMDFIGYSHDLGKISAGFQDMLRDAKKKKADPFRHEFLSILILASENKEDLIRKIELIEKKRFKFSMLSENKNMNWIFKIILSHHLSPELSGSNIVFSKHIRDVETKAAEILKFYEKKEFQDILLKAYELRDKVISMDININRVHYIYFRNALMLSDHYISMKHQQKNWGGDKKTILAKSMELGGEHLSTHLYSVGKMGSYIIEDFTRLKRKLMSLGDNELIAAQSSARGKYIWQNQGVKSLKSVCKNNNCNIVFIGAATGMGKTRMALRVATELAGEDGLRLNVALGLRTLTTQTSKVYKEILEVDNSMIATLIGSTEVVDFEKKIEALDKTLKNKEDKWDENFKDVNKNELEDGIDLEDGIIDLELPKYVANKADSEKKKKLISTPIVISTIDYLIKASDWRKSSHLLSHLRIMTSDLIIDEIDMFDKSDFLHILRMVYVTGLYGRNLIITTATILPKMADLIYSAYFEGVEQFSLYSDGCSDINISYLSDAINKSITDSSRDYEDGLDLIEDCLIKSSDYYYKEHCVK